MKYTIRTLLILLCTPALSGCVTLPSQRVNEREVTWAKMGTPARITDDHQNEVLVPDGKGGWLPGSASLKGMVAIDEPTLEYYQALDKTQREKAGGRAP